MADHLGQNTFIAELTAAPGSGDVPVIIRGASTQTAKLLVVENSAGTEAFSVTAAGVGVFASTLTVTGAQTFTGAATFADTVGVTGATTLAAMSATSITATGTVAVTDTLTMTDAKNIVVSGTTGTKIGTATTQKLGFFNATPVVQQTAYTQTFSTADKTHAGRTAVSVATTGVTQTTPFGYVGAVQGDAVATTINQIIVDLADTAGVVNALVDDLQALGLVG